MAHNGMRVQLSVGDTHGKLEIAVSLWRLDVWFEGFMCAVVQWYLEYDGYSSCVKIRFQETDSENTVKE
jgi:hypothetical protein